MRHRWLLCAAMGACTYTPPAHDPLLESGWFTDSEIRGFQCDEQIVSTLPREGDRGWPVRKPLTLTVQGDPSSELFTARLVDASGRDLPLGMERGETSAITLVPEHPLEASQTYTLLSTDCLGTYQTTFTTSEFGAPLIDGPASLAGRTWQLLLRSATWAKPEGLGALVASQLDLEVLLGVSYADDQSLAFIGAPGEVSSGVITQEKSLPSWQLPLVAFPEPPYVHVAADEVVLYVGEMRMPVYGFATDLTFSADGTRAGDAHLSGLADISGLKVLLNKTDDGAVCAYVSPFGAQCGPCPDGRETCLEMDVVDLVGFEVPGLALVPVE